MDAKTRVPVVPSGCRMVFTVSVASLVASAICCAGTGIKGYKILNGIDSGFGAYLSFFLFLAGDLAYLVVANYFHERWKAGVRKERLARIASVS